MKKDYRVDMFPKGQRNKQMPKNWQRVKDLKELTCNQNNH